MNGIEVSTPSRLCIFGEHQDYLGLEVITQAIDLRFYAKATERNDKILNIKIGSKNFYEKTDKVNSWVSHKINISSKIIYKNNRDYIKSTVNVLLKKGYKINNGYDIVMISEIPIGKGMCSSSTMIIALIKVLLEIINSQDKDNIEKIAYLGFLAEVVEFNEPGGMMDYYASAIGGLINLNFDNGTTKVFKLDSIIPGKFILFDSLVDKDTTKVLSTAKFPVISGLKKLESKKINSIKDFVENENNIKYLDELEEGEKRNILANIDNYKILQEGKKIIMSKNICDKELGALIRRHHENLRDGLKISTDTVEQILKTAYEHGALGGKINGSGGGGCCYVYARDEDCHNILKAVNDMGYPGRIVQSSDGMRVER